MGQAVSDLFELMTGQIINSIRHDCFRYDQPCSECVERGQRISMGFLDAVPSILKTLATDVQATYEGDPAARSHDEIIFSYPGIYAISVHRVAHKLLELGVPLLPRIDGGQVSSTRGQAPIQRLVLLILLAQRQGGHGLRQLITEVECVRRVHVLGLRG